MHDFYDLPRHVQIYIRQLAASQSRSPEEIHRELWEAYRLGEEAEDIVQTWGEIARVMGMSESGARALESKDAHFSRLIRRAGKQGKRVWAKKRDLIAYRTGQTDAFKNAKNAKER